MTTKEMQLQMLTVNSFCASFPVEYGAPNSLLFSYILLLLSLIVLF